jgi:ferrochelatase
LDDGLAQALEVGEGRALGLVMASHQSRGATGGYQDEVLACLERRQAAGLAPGEVDFLPAWHTHPLYLDAVTERAREALGRLSSPGGRPLIVFSAHSLPLREGQPGDPDYETALAETAAGVMERLGDHPWRLAYQSRSLRPGVRWLEPDISAVLEEEALAGRGSVVVVPLGFVVEHLETLYDLDIDLRERAASLGIDFARAATVQDHPLFIEALVDVVLQHLPAAAGKGGNE